MKRLVFTLAIFAACGPPIGGVVFAIATGLLGAVTGDVTDTAAHWIAFVLVSAVLSYGVGLIPAALAGAVYGLTPPPLRSGLAASLVGGVSAFAVMALQRPHMLDQFVFSSAYVLAGAAAACVCGKLADRATQAPPRRAAAT